jgi:hypothetical protein
MKRFAVRMGSQICSLRSWVTREIMVLSDSNGEKMIGLTDVWGCVGGHGMRVGEEKMAGKMDFGRGRR